MAVIKMEKNPWSDLTGKLVKIKRQFTLGRDCDPRINDDYWIVKVKRQYHGRILIESDFVHNVEIPAGEVIEILDLE